jgi:flagellar basal-body rod protein FlgC
MFSTLDISASALLAQRTRMDTIANNVANISTTRGLDGTPFRRRYALFAANQASRGEGADKAGVHVQKIVADASAFKKRYEPGHPDAGADGYVLYPNIDLAIEFVNALEASRAYEANVTTMEVTKSMMNATLRLIA